LKPNGTKAKTTEQAEKLKKKWREKLDCEVGA
jgi:hypothetical protein